MDYKLKNRDGVETTYTKEKLKIPAATGDSMAVFTQGEAQAEKTVDIAENGAFTVEPDAGYSFVKKVSATVAVPAPVTSVNGQTGDVKTGMVVNFTLDTTQSQDITSNVPFADVLAFINESTEVKPYIQFSFDNDGDYWVFNQYCYDSEKHTIFIYGGHDQTLSYSSMGLSLMIAWTVDSVKTAKISSSIPIVFDFDSDKNTLSIRYPDGFIAEGFDMMAYMEFIISGNIPAMVVIDNETEAMYAGVSATDENMTVIFASQYVDGVRKVFKGTIANQKVTYSLETEQGGGSAEYVKKSGDTMTGALGVPNIDINNIVEEDYPKATNLYTVAMILAKYLPDTPDDGYVSALGGTLTDGKLKGDTQILDSNEHVAVTVTGVYDTDTKYGELSIKPAGGNNTLGLLNKEYNTTDPGYENSLSGVEITGVADGDTDTSAVNLSQLNRAIVRVSSKYITNDNPTIIGGVTFSVAEDDPAVGSGIGTASVGGAMYEVSSGPRMGLEFRTQDNAGIRLRSELNSSNGSTTTFVAELFKDSSGDTVKITGLSDMDETSADLSAAVNFSTMQKTVNAKVQHITHDLDSITVPANSTYAGHVSIAIPGGMSGYIFRPAIVGKGLSAIYSITNTQISANTDSGETEAVIVDFLAYNPSAEGITGQAQISILCIKSE